MLYQLTLTIHGRVQGVFFRESTCAEARQLGLVGSVENNAGGTVSVVAEGPKEKLEQLKKFCQAGPPYAKVERVEEEWREIKKLGFVGFLSKSSHDN